MAINQAAAQRIAQAKVSTTGNRIKEGNYVLVVKRILCGPKFKGTFFIPEFDVVASEKISETEPNRKGSDCSCAWQLDGTGKSGEAAKGNIKQFVSALLNIPLEDEAAIMEQASRHAGEKETDPDVYRARGMLVECETMRQTIQSGPHAGEQGIFPRFRFVQQTPEEIALRRQELDANKR